MQQNPSDEVNLGNWYSYFSQSMGDFSPCDSHPTVYSIIWEMHGLPHQFPIVQENATKLIVGENLGKWCSYFSHIMDAFLPLDSDFMVYFITWEMHVFSLISHNMGKDSQIHRMEKVWEIGSRKYPTKPIVCGEPGKLVLILFP